MLNTNNRHVIDGQAQKEKIVFTGRNWRKVMLNEKVSGNVYEYENEEKYMVSFGIKVKENYLQLAAHSNKSQPSQISTEH